MTLQSFAYNIQGCNYSSHLCIELQLHFLVHANPAPSMVPTIVLPSSFVATGQNGRTSDHVANLL